MRVIQLFSLFLSLLLSLSISISFFFFERTGKRTLEQGFFFLSEVREGEVKRKTIFQKKKMKERRKKRYKRSVSWEKRNLRKVIKEATVRRKREYEKFQNPCWPWLNTKCSFARSLAYFTLERKFDPLNIVVGFLVSKIQKIFIELFIIFLLGLTSYNVEQKSRHKKWHRNIDLTKSFFGHGVEQLSAPRTLY